MRTGIQGGEYRVAFEADHFDDVARAGWSVLVRGPAHHLDADDEQDAARLAGVAPWAPGERNHFIRITPVRITGRRVKRGACEGPDGRGLRSRPSRDARP